MEDLFSKFRSKGALIKQIEATEGSKILQRIKIHAISHHIFKGNYEELRRVLEKYHDPNFALQLWDMKNRSMLDLFQKEIVRMLHNYVASEKTLIEHTRKFVREHYSGMEFEREYDSKVKEIFSNPFCAFMEDLRDFFLHNGLPLTSASVHFEKDRPLEFQIKLDVASLRGWSGWDTKAKKFLETLGKDVVLDDLVNRYGSLVTGFYEWFARRLQGFHAKEFEEYNRLQKKFVELYGEFSN